MKNKMNHRCISNTHLKVIEKGSENRRLVPYKLTILNYNTSNSGTFQLRYELWSRSCPLLRNGLLLITRKGFYTTILIVNDGEWCEMKNLYCV